MSIYLMPFLVIGYIDLFCGLNIIQFGFKLFVMIVVYKKNFMIMVYLNREEKT